MCPTITLLTCCRIMLTIWVCWLRYLHCRWLEACSSVWRALYYYIFDFQSVWVAPPWIMWACNKQGGSRDLQRQWHNGCMECPAVQAAGSGQCEWGCGLRVGETSKAETMTWWSIYCCCRMQDAGCPNSFFGGVLSVVCNTLLNANILFSMLLRKIGNTYLIVKSLSWS